jgi:hypothetical protein
MFISQPIGYGSITTVHHHSRLGSKPPNDDTYQMADTPIMIKIDASGNG